jgi:hypothetical protein
MASAVADRYALGSTNKIAAKARYTDYRMAIISETLELISNEIDALMASKTRIERAQKALALVFSVCTECLALRSLKLDKDVTLDKAQVELVKVRFSVPRVAPSQPCVARWPP